MVARKEIETNNQQRTLALTRHDLMMIFVCTVQCACCLLNHLKILFENISKHNIELHVKQFLMIYLIFVCGCQHSNANGNEYLRRILQQ